MLTNCPSKSKYASKITTTQYIGKCCLIIDSEIQFNKPYLKYILHKKCCFYTLNNTFHYKEIMKKRHCTDHIKTLFQAHRLKALCMDGWMV